jgi:predicted ester cyclase
MQMGTRFILLAAILYMTGLFLSCTGKVDPSEKNKAIVLKTFEALNDREYASLEQFIAQDYRRYCQATPDVKVESLDDFKALLQQWDKEMPDSKTSLDMVVSEGDLVAFYGVYSGTQTGQMGPFSPTGKRMECEFSGFHRLEEGKIVETWVTWDNLAILNQLGLFPPPGPGETETRGEEAG